MRTDNSHIIYRERYSPPAFWVDTVQMGFDLDPVETRVATRIVMSRNTTV